MRTSGLPPPNLAPKPILQPQAPRVEVPTTTVAPADGLDAAPQALPLDDGGQWIPAPLGHAPELSADFRATPGRALLSTVDQARFDTGFVGASNAQKGQMLAIVASPGFARATREERHQILEMTLAFRSMIYDDRTASQGTLQATTPLGALRLALDLSVAGQPRLLAPATDGKTALFHLYETLTHPLNPAVAERLAPEGPRQLVAGLLQEIADPRRIDQDQVGTCTVTSVESFTALRMPGEYARIVAGLATHGEVTLASGLKMTADVNGIERMQTGMRTASERLFQASLMQYANPGADYWSDNNGAAGFGRRSNLSELPTFWKILSFIFFPWAIIASLQTYHVSDGLTHDQMTTAASALLGRKYASTSPALGMDEIRRRVGANGSCDALGVFVSINPFIFGVPHTGHLLVISRIDDTSTPPALILRNPWGSTTEQKPGAPLPNGPLGCTYEDPSAGLIRVPLTPQNIDTIATIFLPTP